MRSSRFSIRDRRSDVVLDLIGMGLTMRQRRKKSVGDGVVYILPWGYSNSTRFNEEGFRFQSRCHTSKLASLLG
jgi:hypothetical protein